MKEHIENKSNQKEKVKPERRVGSYTFGLGHEDVQSLSVRTWFSPNTVMFKFPFGIKKVF